MRIVSRLAGATVAMLIVVATTTTVLGAQTPALPDSFTIAARADGVLLELYVPQAPLVGTGGGLVDVSSASAQSLVNSLGRSTAYASAPYPGEIVVGVPGLLNGLGAGDLPPVPDYPLYVNSDSPAEPSRRAELGPYVLGAESESLISRSSVTIGASSEALKIGAVNATAHSSIDESSGQLVAEAWSASDPISIGGLLSVGKVETHVRMEAQPGQAPEVEASTDLGTITIAGIKVGLTDKGLEIGTPLPGVTADVVAALLAELEIGFELLPAIQTDTSYVSAGLRISYQTEVPSLGTVGVTYIVGRASVSISSSASEPPHPGELAPVVDPGVTAPPVAAPQPGPVGGGTVGSAPPAAVADNAGTTPLPSTAPAATRFVPSALDLGSGRFYAALVVIALTSLAASRLLGVFGIRIWPGQPAVPRSAVRLQLPLS